jgi:ubiquinone/menaquinone biosynthesis C-methylase UbiE
MSVAAAFDRLAPRYDALWTNSVAGRLQREVVWREIDPLFRLGSRILDLGCATGEDAMHFAQHGMRVYAIDISPGMVEITRRRVEASGLGERITCETLAIEDLPRLRSRGPFDGVIANFGALNCVNDLRAAARSLAELVRPQGAVAICLLSRFCAWEWLWYLLQADTARAFRRLRRGPVETSLGFPVFYPGMREVVAAFQPYFDLARVRGVGVFVPPSYVRAGLGFASALALLDGVFASWPVLRSAGDHILAVFLRRNQPAQPFETLEASGTRTSKPVLQFQCPVCNSAAVEGVPCLRCGFVLQQRDGIVRAIPPDRLKVYERFLQEYSIVRRSEGRGSEDAGYYLALPYQDKTGRHADQWAIRARTFRYFLARILRPEPQNILDLGAGNGWMSYRLAQRGHGPVAVDIRADDFDGLGAAQRYFSAGVEFPRVQAEFDRLPFAAGQFDLVIFNASLHYSADCRKTLAEAKRCLRPGGCVVVLDSPVYKRPEHGEQMRQERRRQFEKQYGFASDSIPSREYLDEPLLGELARTAGLSWRIYRPWYGWRWGLRPWKARLLGRRPPSRFWILVGTAS